MLEQAPPSGTLGQLAAEMALRHQDPQRALELARGAVSPDSKDYRDHLWLGQFYWTAGRRVEAEEVLHRAVTLASDAPETWEAYIAYLARTEPKDRPLALTTAKADEAIQEAQRRLPPERAALVLARGSAVTGQADQAEQQYQAALAAKPDDVALLQEVASFYTHTGQGPKAEAYLQKILDPRTKASEPQWTWARRQLAMGLATQGGYQKIRQALALVERNLQAQGESVEDQQLKALFLGMQPGGQREAIRVFEDLERHQPPTPDEKFLVARLYEASGNRPKARELMFSALASDGENPVYLASLTRSLLIQGQASEAEPWLARLEKLQPQAAQTMELKARMLVAQGKGSEAAALVKAYTKNKDNLLGPFAVLLMELGQPDAAERMYRDSVAQSKQPEASLVLAEFLARRNRLPEALDLCDQAWQTCDHEKVGLSSLAVLSTAKADDEQFQRVETRLEEAIRKNPNSIPLLFDLANLHIRQGHYQDAETIYRRISERDKSSDGPLNNLAWLLAMAEGKGAESLAVVGQAIDLVGPTPELLDTRALAHMAMGRSDLAIKDLETAITAKPEPVMYLHLAQARLMAKDRKGADAAIQKAKALGLDENELHPLDRQAYSRLLGELARK